MNYKYYGSKLNNFIVVRGNYIGYRLVKVMKGGCIGHRLVTVTQIGQGLVTGGEDTLAMAWS